MKIVISCHKNDFFLTRPCVASIRYYYPDYEIYLLKDYKNGNFSTKEIEKYLKVKILDLGVRNYGWAAAKMHILLTNVFEGERLLILDSDIVFIGRFIEEKLIITKIMILV